MIRLGRISYVNMAPVFYRLDAEVDEVQGVPTDLNARLIAGEIDLAPISSIEYARNADRLRLLPRLCVSSEGAVDSIQLVSRKPARAGAHGRGHARERDLGRPDEGAAPRGRARAARRGGRREAADRRRGAQERVRGSDAALRPRPPLARADRACRWSSRSGQRRSPGRPALLELEDALVESVRRARAEPEQLAYESSERYGYPPGFLARYFEKLRYRFGPRERAGLLHVPRAGARRRRARRGARAPLRLPRRSHGLTSAVRRQGRWPSRADDSYTRLAAKIVAINFQSGDSGIRSPRLPARTLRADDPGADRARSPRPLPCLEPLDRRRSDAQLARHAGVGRQRRHRLDRGGNRQLNCALHRIAVTQGRVYAPARVYLERKQGEGKSRREAIRCLA